MLIFLIVMDKTVFVEGRDNFVFMGYWLLYEKTAIIFDGKIQFLLTEFLSCLIIIDKTLSVESIDDSFFIDYWLLSEEIAIILIDKKIQFLFDRIFILSDCHAGVPHSRKSLPIPLVFCVILTFYGIPAVCFDSIKTYNSSEVYTA